MRRISSDALVQAAEAAERKKAAQDELPRQGSPRARAGSSSSMMLYRPIVFHPPSALAQLATVALVSAALARRLRGRLRAAVLAGLWAGVELLRLLWFRRLIAFVGSSSLRAPVARHGVKPLERASSETGLDELGGHTMAQMGLCQHLLAALRRNHRFDGDARAHLLRKGLSDDTRGWFSLLYTILSNNGTLGVSAPARAEMQKVAAACSNCDVGEPLEPVAPLWGLAARNCPSPRLLATDAALELSRKLLALDLFLRRFKQRRVYVKIVSAEVEYLLWLHRGPTSGSDPPLVFLHGAGAGAVIYGPLLSHLAKSRNVIAVEVPGVSMAQCEEVGPSAILDGLASVVKIALGSQKVYDVVCHSGGGFWTCVLLRAAARGQLDAPRRVVFMQTPCLVPSFLGIYLQGQGHYEERFPVPYADKGDLRGAAASLSGLVIWALFGKDIWNVHLMYTCFAADELVVLPETLKANPRMSVLFSFGEQDGFMDAEACVAYIRDMLPMAHTDIASGVGHGTFMVSRAEWIATMTAVDRFLQTGEV